MEKANNSVLHTIAEILSKVIFRFRSKCCESECVTSPSSPPSSPAPVP